MSFSSIPAVTKSYYHIKPFIPRRLQILLRRIAAIRKRRHCSDIWPIDRKAASKPEGWQGWPDGKRFALVLTHDVDTAKGHDRCQALMELERNLGFRSSFNFVGREYVVSDRFRHQLVDSGFEVGVHGLFHNRQLYDSKETFQQHAVQINKILKAWGAVGFRSPCMYHNLDWLRQLNIDYDASTFDTDPFEPQPDGVGTIFPFYVHGNGEGNGYVELPYTLPQDFTLFILFRERNIETWKYKLDWIAEHGGMALINVHPDYMNFSGARPGYEEYPASYYQEFLDYVQSRYEGQYWHALPKEVSGFCYERLLGRTLNSKVRTG